MGIRSFRVNFRGRGGIDPNLWNQFWDNLHYDLNDIIGSGLEPMIEEDIGIADFLNKNEIAISGMVSKGE